MQTRSSSRPSGSADARLVVAAAVVDRLSHPTRLLAARRSYPAKLAGRWELPGGKVDPGEAATGALHRELAEELDLVVQLGSTVPGPSNGDWPIPGNWLLRVYLAVPRQGSVPRPGSSHDQVRWLTQSTLHDVAWLDGDRAVIGALDLLFRSGPGDSGVS